MAGSTILREDAQPAFSAPIDRLPEEMFLRVIEISLEADSETRLRDLISASDGLAAVRKALSLAQGAPLDLSYDAQTTNIDPKIFFEEIGPHIAQWKSLTAHFKDRPDHFAPDFTFAELETTVAPKLEVLHLGAFNFSGKSQRTITLFGGAPQPSTLKDLWVDEIPISFEPLRLSNLTSLALDGIAWVPATAVLRALRESPGLELVDSAERCYIVFRRRQPAPLAPLTRLSKAPQKSKPFTRSILSSITAPSLRFLHVDCTALGDLVTDLLTPAMSHMIPAL